MSKNYFVTTTEAEFVFNHMKDAQINYSDKRFELHLAQTVGHYKPLLQVTYEFSNWNQLCQYLKNHERQIEIYDEYNFSYSVEEFIQIISDENHSLKSRINEHPDYKRCPQYRSHYYIDKDEFEWNKGDFC